MTMKLKFLSYMRKIMIFNNGGNLRFPPGPPPLIEKTKIEVKPHFGYEFTAPYMRIGTRIPFIHK